VNSRRLPSPSGVISQRRVSSFQTNVNSRGGSAVPTFPVVVVS